MQEAKETKMKESQQVRKESILASIRAMLGPTSSQVGRAMLGPTSKSCWAKTKVGQDAGHIGVQIDQHQGHIGTEIKIISGQDEGQYGF